MITDSQSNWDAQKPALEVSLPTALVEVMPYFPADMQRRDYYDIHLQVSYDGDAPQARILRLSKNMENGGRGITVTLCDAEHSLLMSVAQLWKMDTDGVIHYTLEEETPTDALLGTMSVRGDTVTEFYEVNGSDTTLEYVRNTLTEDAAIAGFAEFYEGVYGPGIGTIGNYTEGSMMMTLVNDTAFVAWMRANVAPLHVYGPIKKPACDLECICYGAAVCAMVTCPIGGTFNPGCDVCAIGAIGCAAAEVASWLFDW